MQARDAVQTLYNSKNSWDIVYKYSVRGSRWEKIVGHKIVRILTSLEENIRGNCDTVTEDANQPPVCRQVCLYYRFN